MLTLFRIHIFEPHCTVYCFLPRTLQSFGEVLGVMNQQAFMEAVGPELIVDLDSDYTVRVDRPFE